MSGIDITAIPSIVASWLHVSVAVGTVITIGLIFLVCIMLPLFFSADLDFNVVMVFALFPLFICVAVGWLPFFGLLIYVLVLSIKMGRALVSWLMG